MGRLLRLFILLSILWGCEDSRNLWIDDDCTPEDRTIIHTAVENLNDALGEEEVVIEGVKDIDYHIDRANDGVDTIYCLYDDLLSPNVLGKSTWGDIMLDMTKLVTEEQMLSVVMHELGHYVSDHEYDEHTTTPGTVMYPQITNPPATEYTAEDMERIRWN